MFYSVVRVPFQSVNNLNHHLQVIQQWAYQWKMEFNPDPPKQASEVLYSCKKSKPTHPPLIFNGTVVQNASEQKHLGLILHSCLSFARQLNEKIKKAKRNIGFIKYLSKFLPYKGGRAGVTHLVPDSMRTMCNTRHSQMGTPPPTVST